MRYIDVLFRAPDTANRPIKRHEEFVLHRSPENGRLPSDVEERLDCLRRRAALDFEKDCRAAIERHKITSPVEQIFLVHWKYLRLDQELGVTLRPQWAVVINGRNYRIDFAINGPGSPIAIEIDGHEFHEKSKDQVCRDKARERDIVKLGYRLMRFSGSEVVKDVGKCCRDVADLIKATPRDRGAPNPLPPRRLGP